MSVHYSIIPIIAGTIFGVLFILVVACSVSWICSRKNRHRSLGQPYINSAYPRDYAVSNINAQFNHHILPSAPPHNIAHGVPFPTDPGYHHVFDHSHQFHHHQHVNTGTVNDCSVPISHTEPPPSYCSATGLSDNACSGCNGHSS